MAQEFSDVALESMLDLWDLDGSYYISAHTGDPGLEGQTANEISGGSYIRKIGVWDTAASRAMALNGTVTLDIPGTNDVEFLGLWDNVSATAVANFMGRVDISTESFGSDGTLDVTAFTLALDQDPA
jgi:hypothetical protein